MQYKTFLEENTNENNLAEHLKKRKAVSLYHDSSYFAKAPHSNYDIWMSQQSKRGKYILWRRKIEFRRKYEALSSDKKSFQDELNKQVVYQQKYNYNLQHHLLTTYQVEDPKEVIRFLRKRQQLLSLLLQVYDEIRKYLPSEKLRLMVVSDPESPEWKTLLLSIVTDIGLADDTTLNSLSLMKTGG